MVYDCALDNSHIEQVFLWGFFCSFGIQSTFESEQNPGDKILLEYTSITRARTEEM